MWQVVALSALLCEKLQDAIDKYAIIKTPRLDDVSASFWRMLNYTFLLGIISLTGFFGEAHIVGTLPLFIVAILWTITSVFYTRLLKSVEVSAIGTVSYAGPFLFLLVDLLLLKKGLTLLQVSGVCLLVFGALLFVIDRRTLRLRSQFSKTVWMIFGFNLCINGFECYLFQYYSETQGMSEATFLLSGCTLSLLCFIAVLFLRGTLAQICARQNLQYAKRTLVSKSLDAFQSLLWFAAIAQATVSQVSAMNAYAPVLLLLITWVMQRFFAVDLKEGLHRSLFIQKLVATVILAIGGILVA